MEASPSLNEDFSALRQLSSFHLDDPGAFRSGLIHHAASVKHSCLIDANYATAHRDSYILAGFGHIEELRLTDEKGAFSALKDFTEQNKGKWIFGFLTYDLKNDVEDLTSTNADKLQFPSLHLFVPRDLVYIIGDKVHVSAENENDLVEKIIKCATEVKGEEESLTPDLLASPGQESYLEILSNLKKEIHLGNIYEINYCRNLSGTQVIDPAMTYLALSDRSPAPFSSFYRLDDKYLMSASPERFLMKSGDKLTSQPMKGTRRRSANKEEDDRLKQELFSDKKERAENVMIVDLVRNDLSHTAERGSVTVEELYGIHSFRHVHQMISTISSRLKKEVHFSEAIRHCFPMGSMTGAPKLRAMKLIEEYEEFKRGLFSGSVGFISPSGNFDFSVVIRSILYNSSNHYLSIPTGSAVTDLSDPQLEWQECELKSKAILSCLH